MKIINIGRSSKNDVVVNDEKVSRTHCQIIQDDMGNFRLIDLNSSNGTYINGVRRAGEVRLNRSDIIRIGNSTLPWQTYFTGVNSYTNSYPNPTPTPSPVIPDSDEEEDEPFNGIGLTGFIFALIGLFTCWTPFLCIFGLLGLIFSIIGMCRPRKGLAMAGLIISIVDSILTAIISIAIGAI